MSKASVTACTIAIMTIGMIKPHTRTAVRQINPKNDGIVAICANIHEMKFIHTPFAYIYSIEKTGVIVNSGSDSFYFLSTLYALSILQIFVIISNAESAESAS